MLATVSVYRDVFTKQLHRQAGAAAARAGYLGNIGKMVGQQTCRPGDRAVGTLPVATRTFDTPKNRSGL